MAYFKDLSSYCYSPRYVLPGLKNVGWLEQGHDYDRASPSDDVLSLLWEFCKFPVAQYRGLHVCDLCQSCAPTMASRSGMQLVLGGGEIRVFSDADTIYAAPNMIYHYVEVHGYKPPDEFVRALRSRYQPGTEEYVEKLKNIGLG
jgi:hypothetical protein